MAKSSGEIAQQLSTGESFLKHEIDSAYLKGSNKQQEFHWFFTTW